MLIWHAISEKTGHALFLLNRLRHVRCMHMRIRVAKRERKHLRQVVFRNMNMQMHATRKTHARLNLSLSHKNFLKSLKIAYSVFSPQCFRIFKQKKKIIIKIVPKNKF